MSFASEFDHALQAVNGHVSRALQATNELSYEKLKAIIDQIAQSGPVKRVSTTLQASRDHIVHLENKVSNLAGDNFAARILLAGVSGFIGGALYAAAGSAASASVGVVMQVVAVILLLIAAYQVLKIGLEALSRLMTLMKRFFEEADPELSF